MFQLGGNFGFLAEIEEKVLKLESPLLSASTATIWIGHLVLQTDAPVPVKVLSSLAILGAFKSRKWAQSEEKMENVMKFCGVVEVLSLFIFVLKFEHLPVLPVAAAIVARVLMTSRMRKNLSGKFASSASKINLVLLAYMVQACRYVFFFFFLLLPSLTFRLTCFSPFLLLLKK